MIDPIGPSPRARLRIGLEPARPDRERDAEHHGLVVALVAAVLVAILIIVAGLAA